MRAIINFHICDNISKNNSLKINNPISFLELNIGCRRALLCSDYDGGFKYDCVKSTWYLKRALYFYS